MIELFISALVAKLSIQAIVIVGVLILMFTYISKQFNFIRKEIKIIKKGSSAGLKNDLKNIHKDCIVCEEKGKQIPSCYFELFYSTLEVYYTYNENDGQVDYWKKDMDRMATTKIKKKSKK